MIALTRRRVRGLRAVLRRHALGLTRASPAPPVVLHALGPAGGVRAHLAADDLAVEGCAADLGGAGETIAVPLDALAELEGRDESPVTVEAVSETRTIVRWNDRGIPQERTYDVPAPHAWRPCPDPPDRLADAAVGLLDALTEAARIAAERPTRYALDGLLLRGGAAGQVVATDGRQILVHGGWTLPWSDAVLVRPTTLLTRRGLPRDGPVAIGRTDHHIVLRVGTWRLWLAIDREGRYPDVDGVLPGAAAVATRLHLDPGEAAALAAALPRLPGADDFNSPVTLDASERQIVVRAGPPTRSRRPSCPWLARTPRAIPCGWPPTAGCWRGRWHWASASSRWPVPTRPSPAATAREPTAGSRWAGTPCCVRATPPSGSCWTLSTTPRPPSRPPTTLRGGP